MRPGRTSATHTIADASATPSAVEPILLEPLLVERIWGTDDLAPWHSMPASGKAVGELWLTAEDCKSASGPTAGRTLAALTAATPERFGDPRREGFPLLIKLLFPREKLSVQVHPNDREAQALGMPRGKTECWYVLSAEPGTQVAVGFQEALSPAQVKASIEDGTLESKLRMIPVQAGDMVFVDAGTVHAIGPGMVVLETQQYSDTTYRLWDYGRPRELHVEAGAAVTRTQTAAGLVTPQPMDGFLRLVASAYFAVDRFTLLDDDAVALDSTDHLQILIALDEDCHLASNGGDRVALPRGKAVVLPVMPEASYALRGTGGAAVIRVLQP